MIPDGIKDTLYQFFVKFIIPAIIMVSVGLMVKMNKVRLTLFNMLSSYIIGGGFAAVFGPAIYKAADSDELGFACVGIVALFGDHLGKWAIFHFELDAFMNAVIDKIKRLFK